MLASQCWMDESRGFNARQVDAADPDDFAARTCVDCSAKKILGLTTREGLKLRYQNAMLQTPTTSHVRRRSGSRERRSLQARRASHGHLPAGAKRDAIIIDTLISWLRLTPACIVYTRLLYATSHEDTFWARAYCCSLHWRSCSRRRASGLLSAEATLAPHQTTECQRSLYACLWWRPCGWRQGPFTCRSSRRSQPCVAHSGTSAERACPCI